MNTMLREQVEFWNNKNLTKCFATSMQNLMIGLQKELIYDTFFPDHNLLDRLDNKIKKECCQWISKLVKKYNMENNLSVFFPSL